MIHLLMQIISGKVRGKKLELIYGDKTRPTIGRVRESIFGIIGRKVRGATVLDLFAGTGAYGAECLSRGAKHVVLSDIDPLAYQTIKKNTEFAKHQTEVHSKDYKELLEMLGGEIAAGKREPFSLVFLDPPYDTEFGIHATTYLIQNKMLAPNATIIFETDKDLDDKSPFHEKLPSQGLTIDTRNYGRAKTYIVTIG